MKGGDQSPQDVSYLGEVGSLSTSTGKAEEHKDKRSLSVEDVVQSKCPHCGMNEDLLLLHSVLVLTRSSPETLGEAQANGRVQLQVQQLLGNVFDPVACVVELRAGSVSVHPLMVDLGRRVWQNPRGNTLTRRV